MDIYAGIHEFQTSDAGRIKANENKRTLLEGLEPDLLKLFKAKH